MNKKVNKEDLSSKKRKSEENVESAKEEKNAKFEEESKKLEEKWKKLEEDQKFKKSQLFSQEKVNKLAAALKDCENELFEGKMKFLLPNVSLF